MFLDFWFFNGFWLENDFIRLTAKNSFFAYGLTKSVKGSGKSSFLRSWVLICDWWISMRFVCFCVSRFVACDRNYHWRQRKTQLWRRLLNFGVRMFVKSAVTACLIFVSFVRFLVFNEKSGGRGRQRHGINIQWECFRLGKVYQYPLQCKRQRVLTLY